MNLDEDPELKPVQREAATTVIRAHRATRPHSRREAPRTDARARHIAPTPRVRSIAPRTRARGRDAARDGGRPQARREEARAAERPE